MLTIAVICLVWYLTIVLVCGIGIFQIYRWYSSPSKPSVSSHRGAQAPHVTIIRPAKGIDARLYDCLASTFYQDYPRDKLSIRLCVDRHSDAAVPVLQALIRDFVDFDVQLLVEEDDEYVVQHKLGPNPKIRSISRAYREVKAEIVWILDCNVWVNNGTCGRMVDLLYGYNGQGPNKFVHQVPLVVDCSNEAGHVWNSLGSRFEQTWFSTAHAKFYTAINTVLVAPCIVGKSNMFRKPHLDALTQGQGTDYFSHNICEDHLIGDLLWYSDVPASVLQASCEDACVSGKPWGKHALNFGDFAIQPVLNMSMSDYFHRRVRWLRVRKFTVMLATLVEPGTESILCSLYGSYAFATLPFLNHLLPIHSTWITFVLFFLSSISAWVTIDWILFNHINSGHSIQNTGNVPDFARFTAPKQYFARWIVSWIGRELLAFPIWVWAILGGASVVWRGKRFKVGLDMRVVQINVMHQTEESKRQKRKN